MLSVERKANNITQESGGHGLLQSTDNRSGAPGGQNQEYLPTFFRKRLARIHWYDVRKYERGSRFIMRALHIESW